MAPRKCCVGGCDATSATHRVYSLPQNDRLRSLWMSFLVPKNSLLLGLTADQLRNRHVCQKHFDRHSIDQEGRRLRYAYPCLFTEEEIAEGEPRPAPGDEITDHNYYKIQDEVDNETTLVTERAESNQHNYCKNLNEEDNVSQTTMVHIIGQTFHAQPSSSDSQASTSVLHKISSAHEPEVEVLTPQEDKPKAPKRSATASSLLTECTRTVKASTHEPEVEVLTPQEDKPKAPKRSATASSLLTECTRTVKESPYKKLGSKHRQFIKRVKNITTESLGLIASDRLNQAQNYSGDQKLFENFHHLPKKAQTFLVMQLRECRKKKMARRFTLEEKLMALLMMKQSPKEYRLLQSMFALPNKRTLHRLSEKISVNPGLNPQILSYIQNKTKHWERKDKLCTIVFDEVALTPHLNYDEKNDQVLGFVDVGGERQLKICDHALVFMLRGINSNWRQTIAYYFCEGTVSAPELQNILKKIVSQLAQIDLTPLGLVCDQGSTFRTAIKKLREDTLRLRNLQGIRDDGSVNIAGHDISVFFDPPHLLKGIRNNFLNKNIMWEGKRACWRDIQFVYDIDNKIGHTRALPKLTEQHVNPEKIKKMKVNMAAQVFSSKTAAVLNYTSALNLHHTGETGTMATTAEVVGFFDSLFDSVNGRAGGGKRGKLRKAVNQESEHVAFWTEAIKKIKKIQFEDCDSKLAVQAGKPRLVRVPSLDGWITTLESFVRLTKLLCEKYGVDYFYPRNINQDPLENFFGRIRALNYRNVNPDANTFIFAFKSLLLTNILSPHSKFANCEEDNGEALIDIGFLFEEREANKENESPNTGSPLSATQNDPPQSSGSFTREDALMEKVKVQCSAYTAGYICRKLTKYIKCKNCLNTYTSSSVEGIHLYIKNREYKSLKNDNLVYPTEKVIRLYRDISQYTHNYLDNNCYKQFITKNLNKMIANYFRFSWLGCSNHSFIMKRLFIKYIIKLQVHNWCNTINKILRGSIDRKYVSSTQQVAKIALKKYQTYFLRKKNTK